MLMFMLSIFYTFLFYHSIELWKLKYEVLLSNKIFHIVIMLHMEC